MDHYKLIDKIYEEKIEVINAFSVQSKYSDTIKLLDNFIKKLSDLSNSLCLIHEHNYFYTSQSISRIIFEHFLVVSYIWNRTRIEETNVCTSEYNLGYLIYEVFKQTNYNSKLKRTYEKTKTPLQNILENNMFSVLNNPEDPMTEANKVEVDRIGNQFDVRNILKYFEALPHNEPYSVFKEIVLDACTRYNVLSSYVHGGRLAELEAIENFTVTDKLKIMTEALGFSEMFKCLVKDYKMILLYLEFDSFFEVYKPILQDRELEIKNKLGTILK